MRSVLRYPGSKWNIASQLVRLIPEHHTYVEPFFGSGAVLFNKQQSNIEMVNDLDSNVVNLFHCIQEDAQNLARMVMTTPSVWINYMHDAQQMSFDDFPEILP